MGRRLVVPVLALAALGGGLQGAWTAASAVPSSTASHASVTVTGATARSLSYTVVGGTTTTVSPRLRGTGLTLATVRARYGSGPSVPCTAGLLTVLNVVTGLREGTWTCTGFAEPAGRPRPLTITVS